MASSNNAPYGYIIPSTATYTPANPTAPASTSAYKMQGLSMLITPVTPTGKVVANIGATLVVTATTVGVGINMQLWYGPVISGVAPPANAAAIPTGAVQLGPTTTYETGVTLTTAADQLFPIDLMGLATGLIPGQQYWFDIAAESITTASACQLTQINGVLFELG
jgi:hypothetical protein